MHLLEAADRVPGRTVILGVGSGTLVTGLLIGLSYGVLAVGLVLVYRATRVVNIAHAEVGAFCAALMARLVLDAHVPWFVALLIVLVVGAAIGAAVELVVVRRLERSPRVVLLVATLGVSQLLLVGQLVLPTGSSAGAGFPLPFAQQVSVGGVTLDAAGFLTLGLVPAVVVALTLFLGRTSTGLTVRAVADDRDAAVLAGINPRRVSLVVWSLAGMLAALTVVLSDGVLRSTVGAVDAGLGPGLLLRALVAALVGGLVSLPRALAGGLAVGIAEAVVQVRFPGRGGYLDVALLVVVLILVLLRARQGGTEDEPLAGLPVVRPLPAPLAQLWWLRRLGPLASLAALLVALSVPVWGLSAGALAEVTRGLLFALVGLSLVVLTGWAGQLSLGQVAIYGLAGMTTAALVQRGVPFGVAVVEATLVGTAVALVIGLPALLVRGLFLAVTTLAFAVAASSAVFPSRFFVGEDRVAFLDPGRLLGLDLTDGRVYYLLCLLVLAACTVAVLALRRSGVGRSIVAVRANPARAAALTISPVVARLVAFALSGALAALAGGLFAGLQRSVGYQSFPVYDSLAVVSLVLIGGLGSVAGPLLGAAYVFGVPALLGGSQVATLLSSSIGLLVLLLYLPGGLAGAALRARDALVAGLLARRGEPAAAGTGATPARPRTASTRTEPRAPTGDDAAVVLAAHGVQVRFGGRTALDGVDVEVRSGEVLGLIGANGAGKSTLLGVLGGTVAAAQGRVLLDGQDITALAPHRRARLGVGRIFQDARLFDELTVRECVLLALESVERAEVVPALLGLPPARAGERRKRALAESYLDALGLGPVADTPSRSLSTGTRRVVELACLTAQGARVLLLDEPTAGLAQRETEAFGPVLLRLRDDLDATLVLVEHDIGLVRAVSDRVQCLEAGRTLATGTAAEVVADPAVIASYLGTDERALARSGPVALTGPGTGAHHG